MRAVFVLLFAASLSLAADRRAQALPHPPSTGNRASRPAFTGLRGLNLHDRIAQLFIVRGYGDFPSPDEVEFRKFQHWIQDDHVGGFIVAGHIRNGNVISAQPFEMAAFINHMQKLAKTPLFVGSDFERGASARVAGTPAYPYQMAFGAARDLGLVKAFGMATAHEAHALGVNWVFAPDADVNNNPDNPIINTRSFGEDPVAVADNVRAFVEGAHARPDEYVLVTAKHFPGHGDTAEDSHLQLAKLNQPRERIESLEMLPFRAAVKSGVDAVMTAHLAVPAFDPDNRPATVSANILTGLLRNELGFNGLVVTDALEMQGIASLYGEGDAAVRALEAGADVLLMPTNPDVCIRAIEAAVASGRLSRARIDRSVVKILAAKRQVGVFRHHVTNLDQLSEALNNPADQALARTAAERGLTVTKDDRHMIPGPEGSGACLVILGESQWTQRGEALSAELHRQHRDWKTYVVTPFFSDRALGAVADDVVQCPQIYVAAFITVSASRGSVSLEGGLAQFLQKLTAAGQPVALISFGNPYLLRETPKVAAYLAAFSTTVSSETAVARALGGKVAISGKMPVSIPGISGIGAGLELPIRVTQRDGAVATLSQYASKVAR